MTILSKFKLAGLLISIALVLNPQAYAQAQAQLSTQKQKELDDKLQKRQQQLGDAARARNAGWRDKLITAKSDCLDGKTGSWDRYNTLRSNTNAYILSRDLARLEEMNNAFPYFTRCPPKQISEQKALAIKRFKTEDRFGVKQAEFFFSGGVAQVDPPQAGYGVNISGGERFAGLTDSTLTGYFVGGNITPRNNKWTLGIQYTEVNGSSEAQIANGTDDVGFVYHDRAPSGSTGVNIGPRGLDVSTNSITSRLRLQFDMSTETDEGVGYGARLIRKMAFGPGLRLTDTEHTASVTTPTFNDISSTSTQKIDENFYYLNGYTTLSFEPNGNKKGGIGLYITPRVEAGYRDASLESRQTNICGLCGASDQNFDINIDDDNNGFYYDLSLDADFGYNVTDTVKVGISGNIGWRSKTAQIVNPETGDDLFIRNNPTHLETDSEYRNSIRAWFSADF